MAKNDNDADDMAKMPKGKTMGKMAPPFGKRPKPPGKK